MPDTPENEDPECFARADLDEAVGRLVEIIRRERPQVMLTYGDDQEGYPHPDHLRVHDVSMLAVDAAADADRFPGGRRAVAGPEGLLVGLVAGPGAGDARGVPRPGPRVAVREALVRATLAGPPAHHPHRRHRALRRAGRALKAHATQIDPTSPFWFGLPDEVAAPRVPAGRLHPRPQRGAGAHARGRSSPGYRSPCDLRPPRAV